MAVQAFCIYITFITVDAGKDISGWKQEMRGNSMNWILFGLSFLILYISKTVAFIALPAIAMALVLMKNYRQAVFAILYFAFFLIIYMIISGLIYGPPDVSQMEMMLRKDLYHPELGHENVSGLTDRFFSNLVTYIGVHAFRILNFKTSDMDAFEVNIFFLILSVAFFLYAILRSKKSNGYIFITSLYAIAMCVVIFFGVHASNTQDRLIIIVMPLIFLVSTYVIYETIKKNYFTGILFTLFISVMFFVTTGRTVLAIEKNLPALKKNIEGDIYYGYNPDWTNFLKISRYCADSLPEDAVVLSRKPGNSFIYGRGKKFEGQYMVTARDPDSVLTEFRRRKIQYFILARIRYNPEVNDGRFISTIHTMTEPISVKYPEKIKIVKVIGDDEFAALCEIKY